MSTDPVTPPAVPISEAAALYDLPPSTLRWWEDRGLLGPPPRDAGRRRYREADLRRLGVAYLCCVTGLMPLSKAAVVAAGQARREDWQGTVAEQIGVLADRIDQLTAARAYLQHLLQCEDADMTDCPYLERELVTWTPRGRLPAGDLVSAARAARGGGGDEKGEVGDEMRCVSCARVVGEGGRGRPRRYCSAACRQRAYRARRGVG
ncbi:helix-turn-helix domain-containing protein [Crossiella cryophila]|uniref:DNA-binding transcriptional MerR regulator n=1 Tax=Crossiella cryophila TaxID=43355 RepID=A0A7W7CH15_9PSEU|nr:MerR family transcriptional regulator [Crossiella cryophila]MBB4679651.1 DNA-binding transcriptional MerR regulator [Crossiella cryophila]